MYAYGHDHAELNDACDGGVGGDVATTDEVQGTGKPHALEGQRKPISGV